MPFQKLKKTLTLFDATSIGIGAIVGAGIFVVLGAASSIAGPATFISIIIAALVALLTASSFALLSKKFTKEGGAYGFAHKFISPFPAFLTGFLWILSNIVAASAVSLGFAQYLCAALPFLPVVPAALLACLLATMINYFGMKQSILANNALVATKLLTLLFFILAGIFLFNASHFSTITSVPLAAILSGAAIIFFAYGGFARVTVLSEEVIDAKKTIPSAIMLALLISAALYVLVSIASIGMPGFGAPNMPSASGAFLADAIAPSHIPFAALIISIGALAATSSVLLTSILGVSRVLFAMSRNNDAPKIFSKLGGKNTIPQNAVLASGFLSCLIILSGNLLLVASISSFALLAYYAATNYSALKIIRKPTEKAISIFGLLSCLFLLLFLSPASIFAGCAATLAGSAYYLLKKIKK